MAAISKVGSKWRAQVRRKGHPARSKMFGTKARAEAWARSVESSIESGSPAFDRDYTVADLILEYRLLREHGRPILERGNEHYMLRHLEDDLGLEVAGRLTADRLIAWARWRRSQGAGRYTVNMELSKLGTVLRYAGAALRLSFPDVIAQARPLLLHMGLIGAGGERDRRPTDDELSAVLEKLEQPYRDICNFAVETAMRRGEITRLLWADVDEAKRLILIRDRKHPREKVGNDQTIPLLGESLSIIKRQPRTSERIFPIPDERVSDTFKAACDAAGVVDLHFHDLRHHGISLLFERGYQIQQVALVSGHRDWRHLRRYTNLKPEDLHNI